MELGKEEDEEDEEKSNDSDYIRSIDVGNIDVKSISVEGINFDDIDGALKKIELIIRDDSEDISPNKTNIELEEEEEEKEEEEEEEEEGRVSPLCLVYEPSFEFITNLSKIKNVIVNGSGGESVFARSEDLSYEHVKKCIWKTSSGQ